MDLVGMLLLGWLVQQNTEEQRRHEEMQRDRDNAATWIQESLMARGIPWAAIRGAFYGFFGFTINILLTSPEQEEIYQEVMAEAMHLYGDVLGTASSLDIKQMHLLDRAWADRYGVSEYAEEVYTPDCRVCGKNRRCVSYLRFSTAAKKERIELSRERHYVQFREGPARVFRGHICQTCLVRLDYTSVSTRDPPRIH